MIIDHASQLTEALLLGVPALSQVQIGDALITPCTRHSYKDLRAKRSPRIPIVCLQNTAYIKSAANVAGTQRIKNRVNRLTPGATQ